MTLVGAGMTRRGRIVLWVTLAATACSGGGAEAPNEFNVSVSPTTIALLPGGRQQFTATVTNSVEKSVTWSASAGTIDQNGLFAAPSVPGSATVTATSKADSSKSATATVSVADLGVTVTPLTPAVLTGHQIQFTATVTGWTDTGVTWSASAGTIDQNGLFTAPSVPGSVTVTATSSADVSRSASTIAWTYVPLESFSVRPSSLHLRPNESSWLYVRADHELTEHATLNGVAATSPSNGAARYVAPSASGDYVVTVASADDPNRSQEVPLTVADGTDVSGAIVGDTTWTVSGSPYYIQGKVQVAAGVTLTLEPGVEVHGGTLELYDATLNAVGGPTSPIRFFDVVVVGRQSAFVVSMQNVEFYRGSIYDTGLTYGNGSIYLRDSDVQDTGGFYIWYPNAGAIERCRFMANSGFSIGIGTGTTFTITNNVFWKPRPGVYGSAIIENWARFGGSLVVTGNSFYRGDTTYVLELKTNYNSNVGMDATQNYWNTTEQAAIDALIFDKNDDLGAENVIPFLPVLSAPAAAVPGLL
jgi:hypothetical protein